ncbi:MAG: hypothetical protein ABIR52_14565, partial [Casimicrobiaceae bacterium]
AIFAGAAAAAALSLILLALGTGLGLSSVSPFAYEGASAKALGVGAIVWLLLMAGVASGIGGYIAGRLRTRWTDVDMDEAYFRDTAHGLLAWAVATLVTAAVLTGAATSMVGTAAKAGAAGVGAATAVAGTAATRPADGAAATDSGYFADMLFRGAKAPEPATDVESTRREASLILTNASSGELPQYDRAYLAQVVASRTGLSQAVAEQRVTQVTTAAKATAEATRAKAQEAADAARKVTAQTALWVFVSLLVGAFYASLTATWGGRRRDSIVK